MYLDSFCRCFFKICIIELGYVRWTLTRWSARERWPPESWKKSYRAFRLSEAVSHLFDDLKAEGGYRRDEDFLAALLNRERCRLGAVGRPTTSTPVKPASP